MTEIKRLLGELGVDIHVVAPMGSSPADIARLAEADFNVVLYPEIADTTARHLQKAFGQPFTTTLPIGFGATKRFVEEVAALAGIDASALLESAPSRLPWYSRSVDSTYLTGKRVFIFGDASHALAIAKVAKEELAFEVIGLGTYSREFARPVREAAAALGLEALITDDYLTVEAKIAELQPEMVLGTQMERHIAKRLGIPCAVISAPVHVQDFPARYSPVMGFEGSNVLFDSLVHPLMMGLEEHLLQMFRSDFEFHDEAGSSHLGHGKRAVASVIPELPEAEPGTSSTEAAHAPEVSGSAAPSGNDAAILTLIWDNAAERELKKIPFFVRGKARRNTERFASERGLSLITVDTLYDAKAHFGR